MPSQRSVTKAETILQAATTVFLAQGYATTTMDQIALAARVSKATVYAHFTDKDTLFALLITRVSTEMLDLLPLDVLRAPSRDDLQSYLMHLLRSILSNTTFLALLRIIIGESAHFPHLAQTFVQTLDRPILTAFHTYLSQPALRVADPESLAHILFGTMLHIVILHAVLQGEQIVPMNYEQIITTLLSLVPNTSSGAEI